MAKRTSFLVRVDPQILEAIRKWSDDEMRSMNGQIEYLLRQSLAKAGRLPQKNEAQNSSTQGDSSPEPADDT